MNSACDAAVRKGACAAVVAAHRHDHGWKQQQTTFWSLFLVFVLGPCEPLIPLFEGEHYAQASDTENNAEGEGAGRGGGDADAGERAGPDPAEDESYGGEILAGELQRRVGGREQGLGSATRWAMGADGELGEDLAVVSVRAGEGDGGRRGRGVERQDQHGDNRCATGPRILARRVVGVSWSRRTVVGFSIAPSAGSAHSIKVTASGCR